MYFVKKFLLNIRSISMEFFYLHPKYKEHEKEKHVRLFVFRFRHLTFYCLPCVFFCHRQIVTTTFQRVKLEAFFSSPICDSRNECSLYTQHFLLIGKSIFFFFCSIRLSSTAIESTGFCLGSVL
jgi:hypothetical protein